MSPLAQDQADAQYIVLAAIDLSALSVDVLANAANLARTSGSELHVVHVLPDEAAGANRGDRALRFSSLTDDERAKLNQMAQAVPDAVKRIDIHVRVGRPDVEIAQLANDIGADLIHGRAHTYSEVPSSYGIGSQTFR